MFLIQVDRHVLAITGQLLQLTPQERELATKYSLNNKENNNNNRLYGKKATREKDEEIAG